MSLQLHFSYLLVVNQALNSRCILTVALISAKDLLAVLINKPHASSFCWFLSNAEQPWERLANLVIRQGDAFYFSKNEIGLFAQTFMNKSSKVVPVHAPQSQSPHSHTAVREGVEL
jgi:hypothetical protein